MRGTLTHYLSGRRVHLRRVTTPNGISRPGLVASRGRPRHRHRAGARAHSATLDRIPLDRRRPCPTVHEQFVACCPLHRPRRNTGRAAILQVRTGNTRQKRQARLADATPPTSASHEAPILRSEPTAMFPMMSSWGSCPHTTTDVPCPIAHLHPQPSVALPHCLYPQCRPSACVLRKHSPCT